MKKRTLLSLHREEMRQLARAQVRKMTEQVKPEDVH